MKEAGINIGFTEYNNIAEASIALVEAHKAGVKLIVFLPELLYRTEEAVKALKDYPALYAYSLKDEPSPSDFSSLQSLVKKIQKIDSKTKIYINLLPNYATFDQLGNRSYRSYVIDFLNTVKVPILSFDHYPVQTSGLRQEWYSNLEQIRNISLEKKLPFWAFANTTIHYNYPKPTIAALKLQQFSNLLYGAQGLQYFTYWTNSENVNWIREKYGYGIVYNNGNPTPTYNLVKSLNEQIQRLSWVFLGGSSKGVFHTGSTIPEDTKRLNVLPEGFSSFNTNNNPFLIALMTNNKNQFVIVQNKSLTAKHELTFTPKSSLSIVNTETGSISKLKTVKQSRRILPGDILIFVYK